MRVERSANTASLLDVLDRVLDKGIVVDAWVRLSLVGIELVTVEAHVIVASFSTYLGYAGALSELKQPPVTAVEKSSPSPWRLPLPAANTAYPSSSRYGRSSGPGAE